MHNNGERPFKCEKCPKTFAFAAKLTEHVKIHHGDTSFTCEICGTTFNVMFNLRQHIMNIHTKTDKNGVPLVKKERKPRTCPEQNNLIRLGPSEWECKICQAKIKGTTIQAKRHVISKHGTEEDKPHACHLCEKRFLRNCTLQLHIARHENKRGFSCGYCDKSFNVQSCRDIHERHIHLGLAKRAVFNSRKDKHIEGEETVEERRARWMNEQSDNQMAE